MENTRKNTPTLNEYGEKPITLKQCIAYGLSDSGDNICFAAIGSLLTLYYTDYIGVPAASIALIMLLSRFLDGFSDFIAGRVMDNTKSKYGKCRPWIMRMAIPFSVGVVACFTVPDGSLTMKCVYIFIAYNFLNAFAYTFSNLSQNSVISLMTRDEGEREKLSRWRLGITPIAHIMAGGLTLPLVLKLGDDQRAWVIVMGLWALWALIVHVLGFIYCEEQVHVEKDLKKEAKVPLGKAIKALIVNPYWWWGLTFWMLWATAFGISGTTMSYYCKYTLGDEALYSGMYIGEKVIYMITILVLVPLIRNKGVSVKLMIAIGFAVCVISHLLLLVNPTSVTWCYIPIVGRAIGVAPSSAFFFAMLANAVEYGQWKTHIRQEPMIFSCASVAYKAGGGVLLAVLTWIYGLAGYVSSTTGGAVQPQSALDAITALYIWAPVIVYGLLILVTLCYKLENKMPMIMKELKEREVRGEM